MATIYLSPTSAANEGESLIENMRSLLDYRVIPARDAKNRLEGYFLQMVCATTGEPIGFYTRINEVTETGGF